MIARITKEPVPFVPSSDRDKEIQTVFGIRCMAPEQSANYRARWSAAKEEYNVPAITRARNSLRVDTEMLSGQIDWIKNAREAGDELQGEEVAKYVTEEIDFLLIQELGLAAQSMSVLEAGRKKS